MGGQKFITNIRSRFLQVWGKSLRLLSSINLLTLWVKFFSQQWIFPQMATSESNFIHTQRVWKKCLKDCVAFSKLSTVPFKRYHVLPQLKINIFLSSDGIKGITEPRIAHKCVFFALQSKLLPSVSKLCANCKWKARSKE